MLVAACGVPAYTFQGIYKELRKARSANVQDYIIAARITQEYGDLEKSSLEQRLDVVKKWQVLQAELGKSKKDAQRGSPQSSPYGRDKISSSSSGL